MDDPVGRLSADGRWRWDGTQWVPTGVDTAGRTTNGLALAAFICSLALPLVPLTSIAGVVLGVVAIRQIRRQPQPEKGEGLAIAAIVIGLVVIILVVILLSVVAWFGYECRNGC